MASNPRDHILIIDDDPGISDLIGRQALQSSGYGTEIVSDAGSVITKATQTSPDAIIVSLNLTGFSAKDLIVALNSQGSNIPIIVRARKGSEADIIQAFRLGAIDYIPWPVREAEVVTVVERALKMVHGRREREQLAQKLQQSNTELEQRLQELTTLFSIGKAVTSINDQSLLFERILGAAAKLAQANLGWFLLSSESNKTYLLASQFNLPASLAENIHQPWDDGISSLVAMSGETLSIHGEALKRFKIANLGQAALIVPVKVQKQVMGLLVLMRKALQPFTARDYHVLEALADFAAISLVNSRLFRTIENRAHTAQSLAEIAQIGEKINFEILTAVKNELSGSAGQARAALDKLAKDPTMRWSPDQRQTMTNLNEQVQMLNRIAEALKPTPVGQGIQTTRQVILNDLLRQAVSRYQPLAQQNQMALTTHFPQDEIIIQAEANLISNVLASILSHALEFNKQGGQITLQLERTANQYAHVTVTGGVLESKQLERIFDPGYRPPTGQASFGGLCISLALAKEILANQRGKLWVESGTNLSSRFHIEIPITS